MTTSFYTSIAPYYQHIFPFNPDHIDFLRTVIPYNGARILDVGCATGDLAFALTHFGFPTWAIDFDAQMIEKAQHTKQEDAMFPVFEQLDMRSIDKHFPASYFNTVICFGNTLVHLLSDDDILRFFSAASTVLANEGKFTFQILNYNHILDHQIKSLPIIENEHIHFERSYEFGQQSGLIEFNTNLLIKSTGQEIRNSVLLYPIRSEKIKEMLNEVGFQQIELLGNFKRATLTDTSLQLVVSCSKS